MNIELPLAIGRARPQARLARDEACKLPEASRQASLERASIGNKPANTCDLRDRLGEIVTVSGVK